MVTFALVFGLLIVPMSQQWAGAAPASLFAGVAVVHLGEAAATGLWSLLAPGSISQALVRRLFTRQAER